MTDILNKIVSVKRLEVAAAIQRKSLAAMRFDAESRVLTRDFGGALRAKIAAGQPAVRRRPGARASVSRSWAPRATSAPSSSGSSRGTRT